ncbi:hypothetical protein ASF45_32025 [Pseudorhodoferax sp. Leaf265]|nr:hypothetical protein ASF45_32025 [Pseudorhodoferax sp. Leaf265]
MTAVGGLCLHLMGATYNAEYYRRWGLDAAFFPLSTDATVVLGYEAFVNGVAAGALALFRDLRPWLYGYGTVLAGTLLVGAWIGWRQLKGKHVWSPDARWRRVAPLAVPVFAAFAVPALVIPYAGMLGVFALALPMSTAEHYARQQADARLLQFKAGCDDATGWVRCTTVTRNGTDAITGFLVGASSSHVAIYDPVQHRVTTLERAGLKLSAQGPGIALDWKK